MRILLLANSYPSAAAPSGAPYMTARVQAWAAMEASGEPVEVTPVALRPTYTRPARVLRRVLRTASDASLALAESSRVHGWVEAPVLWRIGDLVASRRGLRPERAVARAVEQVAKLVGSGRRIDVIHAHGMYTMPAGEVGARLAARWGLPLVVTMHGSDVEQAMAAGPARARDTLRQAAATTYVSSALAARAQELGAPTDHAYVIPNGVDTARFSPRQSVGGSDETQPSGPHLLYVGNLAREKGADRLPGIVREVAAQRPGVRLTVAGDGPLASVVSGGLGDRVTMLGRVSQERVAELMRAADVLVVPSRAEGWGCVVSESYASGTPVVASDVGGLVESALPGALVEAPRGTDDEAEFTRRFAARVVDTLDAPPSPGEMSTHVEGFSWAEIVAREYSVLREVTR